jgi:hypothetical protein
MEQFYLKVLLGNDVKNLESVKKKPSGYIHELEIRDHQKLEDRRKNAVFHRTFHEKKNAQGRIRKHVFERGRFRKRCRTRSSEVSRYSS